MKYLPDTIYSLLSRANFQTDVNVSVNSFITEPPHDKTNNVAVRPAKTQIQSLRCALSG